MDEESRKAAAPSTHYSGDRVVEHRVVEQTLPKACQAVHICLKIW
jgi:hypothetical protein